MVLTRVPVSLGAAVVLSLLALVVTPARAAESSVYALDPAASAVDFTIFATKIFTFKRQGEFKEFSGQISFDPQNPLSTQVDLTVVTSSVDIHNSEHNQLLKSEGFFDVGRFPTMRFTSSSADVRPDGTFSWTGDLTIHGITQHMTIPVKLRQAAQDGGPSGSVFESTFEIDRTEFGIVGVPKTGGLDVSISKKVRIHLAFATSPRS
jgi:polyisoprenoid-binding protein YceI